MTISLKVPTILNEVNFLCDFSLLSVATTWSLRLLWVVRILLTTLAIFLFFGCDSISETWAWILMTASAFLYLVYERESQGKTSLQSDVYDASRFSVIAFVLNLPAWSAMTIDRYTVPILNLAATAIIVVMALVLKPLEEAWGCYRSTSLSGLIYGTCPQFHEFEVADGESGSICSRPQATIDCVTRQDAFSDEHTARFIAFILLGLSLVIYFGATTSRSINALEILNKDKTDN